jgi:hypothetical protein
MPPFPETVPIFPDLEGKVALVTGSSRGIGAGTGLAPVGRADDSSLLAASARTQRTQLLDLARTVAARVALASDSDAGSGESVLARALRGRVQPPLPGGTRATRQCFCTVPEPRSGADLLAPVRTCCEPRQHGELSESQLTDGASALASDAGRMPGRGASALGWNPEPHARTTLPGTIHGPRHSLGDNENAGASGGGKDARRKSHEADFPSALGNPAQPAGFPLSHRPDGCCRLTETGHIMCYEKRTF